MHPQKVIQRHQAEWCSRLSWGKGYLPEGPSQAWEAGLCERHEVQQGQVQGHVSRLGQSPISTQSGERMDWEQSCGEGFGYTIGWKIGPEPAVCTSSPERQSCSGLHQKKCCQKVKGGDLPHSGETSLGVLHPALEPSARETWTCIGTNFSAGPVEIRQGVMIGNSFTLKRVDLDWTWGRNFLQGWWNTGRSCPERCPSLEKLEVRLNGALSNMTWGDVDKKE